MAGLTNDQQRPIVCRPGHLHNNWNGQVTTVQNRMFSSLWTKRPRCGKFHPLLRVELCVGRVLLAGVLEITAEV